MIYHQTNLSKHCEVTVLLTFRNEQKNKNGLFSAYTCFGINNDCSFYFLILLL